MKARLPQGYGGGGGGNMNSIIRQAQKVQENAAKIKEELLTREHSASSGGGMVEVTVTGDCQIKSITLKPEVVDPDDIEMLSDLLTAAVNQALRTVKGTEAREMEKATGGMSLPGMF